MNIDEIGGESWARAKAHLDKTIEIYESLQSVPGVNTTIALVLVLRPLRDRYSRGVRSPELYAEMLAVE